MSKIVIAGGTGFLGRALAEYWSVAGHEVHILSRHHQVDTQIHYHKWDAETLGSWVEVIEGSDLVLNLAGRSVDCRYNRANREEIYDSRLKATRAIGNAIQLVNSKPGHWINMSTATIYRDEYEEPNDEASERIGKGFSVDVAKKWEYECKKFHFSDVKLSILRTAIVLDQNEGAFPRLMSIAKCGFNKNLATGNQWFSWIHIVDFLRAVDFIFNEGLEGTFNLSSPNPIVQRELAATIRRIENLKFGFHLPAWMIHFGARIVGTSPELILKSRWVLPTNLMRAGFVFHFETIRESLQNLNLNQKQQTQKRTPDWVL